MEIFWRREQRPTEVPAAEEFNGAGYGDRTRLTGLGSQGITTMLSPQTDVDRNTPPPPSSGDRVRRDVQHALAQLRMNAITSSRFASIFSGVVASRLSRSNGSVFEARTLKCQ